MFGADRLGCEIRSAGLLTDKKRALAEEGGFEPPVECYPYDGLANRCFRPLSHPSVSLKVNFCVVTRSLTCRPAR